MKLPDVSEVVKLDTIGVVFEGDEGPGLLFLGATGEIAIHGLECRDDGRWWERIPWYDCSIPIDAFLEMAHRIMESDAEKFGAMVREQCADSWYFKPLTGVTPKGDE